MTTRVSFQIISRNRTWTDFHLNSILYTQHLIPIRLSISYYGKCKYSQIKVSDKCLASVSWRNGYVNGHLESFTVFRSKSKDSRFDILFLRSFLCNNWCVWIYFDRIFTLSDWSISFIQVKVLILDLLWELYFLIFRQCLLLDHV